MFTATQERQLDFLDRMEGKESLGDNRTYAAKCKDCGKTEVFHSAGSVSGLFMPEHAGHATWITLG